jgi:hypothetical protein
MFGRYIQNGEAVFYHKFTSKKLLLKQKLLSISTLKKLLYASQGLVEIFFHQLLFYDVF